MQKLIIVKKLLRIQQWVKNLFLFIPIFFAGELFEVDKLLSVFIGFLAFCFASSTIYILNDIKDLKYDRLHPEKSKRPIPSGQVSVKQAYSVLILMLLTAVVLSFNLPMNFKLILGTYVLINVFYSFGLKKIAIIDIVIVGSGFVLRTISGGILANVSVSYWLVIMIFLLSLFLVVGKRREDIQEFLSTGRVLRKSIEKYNLEFIDSVLTMLSGVIIVSYILYTISDDVVERFDNEYLYLTGVFVIVGLMRYLQIILVENKSGSPVKVLYTDRFIHITLLLWVASFFVILYVLRS